MLVALFGVLACTALGGFAFFGVMSSGWCLGLALAVGTSCAGAVFRRRRRARLVAVPGLYAQMAASLAQQIQGARAAGARVGGRPTYLVLGAPGSGKSAVLRAMRCNGGAAEAASQGSASCKLWLGDDANFVEAGGGRGKPAHDDAWRTFVAVLRRKFGPRRLAGVCAVFDARSLAPGVHQPESLDELRAQLCSLEKAFGVRLPVYVLLTHLDALTGFHETFAALDPSAQQQVLGFTLPEAQLKRVATYFQELTASLWTHATMRLDAQMALPARRPLFLFAHQFASLAPGVQQLVDSVFGAVGFGPGPDLRGIYFTAADAGAVPEWTASGAAPLAMLAPELDRKQVDFFAGRLETEVLRLDRSRPPPTTRRGVVGLWHRQPAALVGCIVLATLTICQVVAWRQHRQLLGDARRALGAVQQTLAGGRVDAAGLRPLRDHVGELLRRAEEGAPWVTRLAPNQGEAVFVALARAYGRVLQREALGGMFEEDVRALGELWRAHALREDAPAPAPFAAATTRLKMHLLLTQPREAYEPQPTGPTGRWLALALAQRWVDLQAVEPDPQEATEMGQALALYVRLLASVDGLGLARQSTLVERTRAVLKRQPLEDALVSNFLQENATRRPPLRVHDLLGSTTAPLRGRYVVPGALTREGWEQLVRPWLEEQAARSDAWVFGPAPDSHGAPRQQAHRLRSRYLARYIEAWQQFLDGLSVATPAGTRATLETLEGLTRGEPLPYRRLFAGVADNTRLSASPTDGGGINHLAESLLASLRQHGGGTVAKLEAFGRSRGATAELLEPADVEASFATWVAFGAPPAGGQGGAPAVALDDYHEHLIGVRNALQGYVDDPREADAVLRRVRAAQHAAHAAIEQRELAVGVRPRLEALLLAPLAGITQSLATNARAQLGASFCADVAQPSASLMRCYPFARQGADAPLAEVVDFFRPQTGRLWGFYGTHLKEDVTQLGERFAFDARLGGVISGAYNPALLPYLGRAQALTRALFAPGQAEAAVSFDARLITGGGTREVELRVDGQVLSSPDAQPSWQRIDWPGPERGQGAALTVKDGSGASEVLRREGEWGLFRLLEDGRVERRAGQAEFTVVWSLASQAQPVRLEIRSLRRDTPFFAAASRDGTAYLGPFRHPQLRAPGQLTRHGSRCGDGT